MNKHEIVGVVSRNSITYVKALFNCYASQKIAVLLRTSDDSRIPETGVTRVIEPDHSKGWWNEGFELCHDDTLAQIAFTSGTEGEPKGVLLTHRALSDVTERLNQVMEVDESIREYVGVPANFSFGLGRFRAVAAAGGASFLPAQGFNPLEIRDMLRAGEINAISAVPSLWRILLENRHLFGAATSSLKWIEIGSQYMSRGEKEELKLLFPKAIIVQHYGLTEASRSTFLRIDQTEGEALESVGQVYGQTEIRISEMGRICIRGPNVAGTLLLKGQQVSSIDDKGWLETGDLGHMNQGYLYFDGRMDDLINCGGIKLSPDALERDLRKRLGLNDGLAVAAARDRLTGDAILVATLQSLVIDEATLLNAAGEVLLAYGINNRRAIKRLRLDAFPLTDTNKVQRKLLACQYEEKVKAEKAKPTFSTGLTEDLELTADERKIKAIWQNVLENERISLDNNFYDMGGDSLSALTALLEMERLGVPADITRGLLQGLSIREIAQRMRSMERTQPHEHRIRSHGMRFGMSINVVRGLMVIAVIVGHWHQGLFERILDNSAWITMAFAPFFAMGTPGFAVMHGVGAGYSLLPLIIDDGPRLRVILKNTFLLLLMGILLLGAILYSAKWRSHAVLNFTDFSNSFYSVLTYYLLVTATLYPILSVLAKSRHPIQMALFLSILSYATHFLLIEPIADFGAEGLIELAKLLLAGKYGYFQMLAGSLMGMAIGIVMQRWLLNKGSLDVLKMAGLDVMLVGIVGSLHQPNLGEWFIWPLSTTSLFRWLAYAGLVMMLMAATEAMLKSYDSMTVANKLIVRFFSTTGMLAFPLFLLHEITIPLKSILTSFGLSGSLSMFAVLLMFFSTSFHLYIKLYRAQYG